MERGKHFFFTGRGRWSDNAWSSCASCHPGGLSDNVTWVFAAGPRQSTSLDGSFSHGAGGQKQRIFNWTGIFDELHDFERNTRGVQGGLGAVTVSASGKCGTPGEEQADPAALPGNLAQPIKELQDRPENCHQGMGRRRSLYPSDSPASAARGALIRSLWLAGRFFLGCRTRALTTVAA